MKCDEVKPVCGPCAKGNRDCVYGSLPSSEGSPRSQTMAESHPLGHLLLHGTPSRISDQGSSNANAQQLRHHANSFSSNPGTHASPQWQTPSGVEDANQITSPQSTYSSSTGYGTEVAPLRWFGLLAGDAANSSLDIPSLENLSDAALAQRYRLHPDGVAIDFSVPSSTPSALAEGLALQNPSRLLQISAISPAPLNSADAPSDERQYWQAAEPVKLKDHEYDMFQRFITGLSLWIDLFDPLRHFASFVPHLALMNEGLMRAILALGARHLSLKPLNSGEATIDRTAAVQYYYETLQYLQKAMRFTSYKNSLELLATVLVVSTYEMIDGAGKGWERHLKGVFWIQRSRDINGESGGLEQAIWWAWLRQDAWAAFKERRRLYSFFKPTKPYHLMSIWDMAARITYILAQAVNYSSDEENRQGVKDINQRILRANTLLGMLDEWRRSITVHFEPLPVEGPSNRAFKPLWIHPPFGASVQMYCMARILLLINQPAARGYLEYVGRDRIINECIDTIGGIAMKISDDPSRLMSTQCLYAAGLYCTDDGKRREIADLIEDHQNKIGWPSNTNLADELRAEWTKKPG